jgi:hypothetical protein
MRVPINLLEQLAAKVGPSPQKAVPRPSGNFDVERWIQENALDVEGPSPWQGGRRWIFPICPFNPEHQNRSAFIVQLASGALDAGCLHNSCRGKDWHTLRDLVDPGWRDGRVRVNDTRISGESIEWQAPVPFDQIVLPVFPTRSLPEPLRAFVEALATATQTPVDLAGMLVLSAMPKN